MDEVTQAFPARGGRLREVRRYGAHRRVIERRAGHAYQEFTRRMMALHGVVRSTVGQMPMCSCGSVARMCPALNAAHDLLGHPVPWE